ncbi:MAG: cytochrome c oxidase subunit II [Deinococcales bacterium]
MHNLYSTVASVLSPASPYAADIGRLFWITFWISMVILVAVSAFVIFNLIRYRDRGQEGLPPQTHGNMVVEVTWTAIPLAILVVLFVLTMQTMAAVSPSSHPKADPVNLDVIAHQWWWEFRYPGSDVVTANELHIPVGTPIHIELTSADVIHDFWVPELGRKMDAVPGHPNTMLIQADKPGVYLGACAEYCGAGHAWMRIRVIAQTESDYQNWLKAQAQPHPAPKTSLQAVGMGLFNGLTCSSCHVVKGSGQPEGHVVGPDLTHLADRQTLAAGVVPNTPAELKKWLADPHSIKPGVYMPNLHLTSQQLDALVAYLEEQP